MARKVAGLSPAARWLAVAQAATWLTYGLAEHVRLQIVTNAICLSLHLSVLAALLLLDPAARTRRVVVPQAALAVVWLGVVAAFAVTGAAPVGTLAATVGAVAVVPQLWSLLRHRGGDTSGVSTTTTALSLLAGLCWTVHGLALALPAVALPSMAGAVAAAWTLALLRPAVARPVRDHRPQTAPVVLPLQRMVAA